VSEGMPNANDIESLAWVALQTANRTQAKGSRLRIVVPRAPEVADVVGKELTEAQLLAVEGYLYLNGYVERVEMGLSGGTYTITPAGFEWLEGGMPEEPPSSAKDPVRELAQGPRGTAKLYPVTGGAREETEKRQQQGRMPRRLRRELHEARKHLEEERPWWRRMFGA
jgi:hypothetical protein